MRRLGSPVASDASVLLEVSLPAAPALLASSGGATAMMQLKSTAGCAEPATLVVTIVPLCPATCASRARLDRCCLVISSAFCAQRARGAAGLWRNFTWGLHKFLNCRPLYNSIVALLLLFIGIMSLILLIEARPLCARARDCLHTASACAAC